jgi:hypothetical protein
MDNINNFSKSSKNALLDILSEPVCNLYGMTDSEKLNWLIMRALKEDSKNVPWVTRNEYARLNNVKPDTVYKHTERLRLLGAAEGKGKFTRYNPLITINGVLKA